jgi:hypothetical protein
MERREKNGSSRVERGEERGTWCSSVTRTDTICTRGARETSVESRKSKRWENAPDKHLGEILERSCAAD